MIEKVIQIADIHTPNVDEKETFSKLLEKTSDMLWDLIYTTFGFETTEERIDKVRILLIGDIYQNKNKTSPEANTLFYGFLNRIKDLGTIIIVAGNHDLLENNKDRQDAISPLFDFAVKDIEYIYYADKILSKSSGYIEDDGIDWVIFSIMDGYRKPDLSELEGNTNIRIGLYHGDIEGSSLFNGQTVKKGLSLNKEDGINLVLCGHIHKRQFIEKDGIRYVYSGSLFQQHEGESITKHGFIVWDIPSLEYTEYDIDNEYSIIKFKIDNYDDVENGLEKIVNL